MTIAAFPTLRVPAMADWTHERADASRDQQTAVWEDAPRTVVEVPWWLRERSGGEPTRRELPSALREQREHDLDDAYEDQADTEPLLFGSLVFPPIDDELDDVLPRQITRYNLIIDRDSDSGETTDEIPLPRRHPGPPRAQSLGWRLALCSLLALGLGSLLGASLRLLPLIP